MRSPMRAIASPSPIVFRVEADPLLCAGLIGWGGALRMGRGV